MTTTYAPPPGPPPTRYNPPLGPAPSVYYPPPLKVPEFHLLTPQNIHSLSTQGFTTFPIQERVELYRAATSLFDLSKQFFSQPQPDKERFINRDANMQGSEEGWSRVAGEKELLTLRRSGATCPDLLEHSARSLWLECGQLMTDVIRGIEQSLDLIPHSLDSVFIPECTMPLAGENRFETLLRMFRYERRSESIDNTEPRQEEIGKGRLVAEPHRDLGLLSLVIGSSPGLEVWDTTVGHWIPIEQPPYAYSSSGLTATLLVGETLTYLTNGRYLPGRHRVFVPSLSSTQSTDDHQQYRYSLVFALRPHSSAIISTGVLTSPITGPFRHPLEGVKAGDLFSKIARSHWNINTGKREREAQRMRLQNGSPLIVTGQSTSNQESDHSTK
ncbi:hypothetical protein Clacol_002100 [Clathrus columnatus]|uniref:Isopenicillin N synthase-like Fe(2+) 2OG dioxygenase domain-containing protein n=1 Tax=Clathrus columnatus TaxID=1419009 RepID=A0AAV5A3R1_9AGAM|nr:hypothetical protein Clacol_002100 [Clathrus columnatus]